MIMALKVSLLFSFILILLFVQSHAVLSHSHDQKAPPFEFIKHLQGCHKGDKVKGLHELKKYLQNFGYFNKKHGINDDDFDDLLESAIKTYQLNYHLKATGTLDAKTVSMMMLPRCGVPDIVNGTTWMRSGRKRHHHHGHNKIHEVSHYSFFPGNPRWPPSKTYLTYRFLPNTPARVMDPVARAFNRWASATSYFTFSRVQDHTTADLTIGFVSGDHGDGYPFDGTGGTLAHAFSPPDGRFHYDADEPWSVGASPVAYDLETIALHEIGHLLGLGHSSVRGAIMESGIGPGVTKDLHGDDIQGIRALYGI